MDNLLWRDVFLYNVTHVAQVEMVAPVAAAATLPLLATQSILFLGATRSLRQEPAAGSVWAVIAADYFETAPPMVYEEEFAAWDITFERRKFHGIRDVYVYRLHAAPTLQLPYTLDDFYSRQQEDSSLPFSGYLKHEDMQAFAELATAFAVQQRKEQALGLMADLFRKSPFSQKVYGNLEQAIVEDRDTDAAMNAIDAIWKGYGYRENERHELARQAFANALALDPDNGVAALELGFELTGLAQYEAAATALERAAVLDEENAELVDNLVKAIRIGNQIEQSFRAVTLCREGLIALSDGNMDRADTLFQQALAEDSQLPRAQVMLGFIRALQERYDEAFDLFSAYLDHGKYHAPVAYSHLAIIHLLRDEPEQALQYATKAMALDPEFKRQAGTLVKALLEDKDYEGAADEVQRMEEAGVHVPSLFKEYLRKHLQ